MGLLLAAYAVLILLVVFFSARLSYYVDLLDQKTTMASAFIGGVMLAAVTSLPELMTSITSVALVGKPELVIGNILGSNLFNVAVLGTVFLLYFKGLRRARVTASHNTTIICVVASYGLIAVAYLSGSSLFFYGVSLLSLVIFGLYLWSIRMMANDEDTSESTGDVSPLTLRQVALRFVIYSILLASASVAITYASDYIGELFGLGTTLAGALLLGIATSLPELISCVVLARIGNFNAMTGNIVGSNIFNFAILFVADIVYWNKELYVFDHQGSLLIWFGLFAGTAVLTLVRLLVRANGELERRQTLPTVMLSAVPIVCYVAFVSMSVGG